jgi:serine/threonine protein kinase/Tol biopolymer transport system component
VSIPSVLGTVLSEGLPTQLAGFQTGSLLAGYRLEAQVGAGGMAVVFRARDEQLGRLVALKILAPSLASDSDFRRRFISESRAAAVVDDPHIIPVYQAGEVDGVLFIAMRFVGSGDLRQVLGREGPLAPDRAAEFVSQVASALDAAHRAGLVHRDVKPGNILVDTGADRPDHAYLSDFGISKKVRASAGLTGTGMYLGTAVYSAPEQIQGRAVDGRTDQYALACVAFQLLTGTVPFELDQVEAVLYAHLYEPPPSLGSRRPGLPGAADKVLARAMAKVPEQRYGTCQEFADALRAALSRTPYAPGSSATAPAGPQPPATLPSEVPSRAAAPADQRKGPEPRTGGETLSLAPHPQRGMVDRLSAIKAWTPRRRLAALAVACAVLAAAGAIPFVLTSQAKSPSPANSPGPTPSPGPANSQSYSRVGLDLPSPYRGNSVLSLAFSRSGSTLAIADSYLCLWDIPATGCSTAPGLTVENSVAFSPDGTTLAVGDINGGIGLLNVATLTLTAALIDPGSTGVDSIAFSPDGTTLAAGDDNGRTYLWSVTTGKLAATLTDPGSKGVKSVAFSRDGTTLAAGDFNGRTYLWNIATKTITATLADPASQGVDSIAFSRDGTTLAAGDFNGRTYLWNIATKTITAALIDPGSQGVDSIAFSPDGTTLAVGDDNGRTYLWNVATKTLAATLTDPGSTNIYALAFSPDGKTLATGDGTGNVYLWHRN